MIIIAVLITSYQTTSVHFLLAAPYNVELFIFSYEKISVDTKAAAQEVCTMTWQS